MFCCLIRRVVLHVGHVSISLVLIPCVIGPLRHEFTEVEAPTYLVDSREGILSRHLQFLTGNLRRGREAVKWVIAGRPFAHRPSAHRAL